MKTPRFTVTRKIVVGLSVILLIGMLSMLFIYRGLNIVDRTVQVLAEVEQPTSLAAYEMEINVNGMGLAVLKYMDDADPFYRAWVSDDDADFRAFRGEYLKLVNTSRERELGNRVSRLFDRFEKLARSLMEGKDQQVALFQGVLENLEKKDRIIDEQIQPAIDRQSPDALAKIEASMDMEAGVAEIGLWTTVYQYDSSQRHRQLVFAKKKEFRQALAQFRRLDLAPANRGRAEALQRIADQTRAWVLDILALEDKLDEQTARFVDLRFEMDNLLDDEIQLLALEDLTIPRIEAEKAADGVLRTTSYLIPVYILTAIAAGLLLIKLIHRPLKRLVHGTTAIGGGDLNYRIALRGRDEFADLANHFNRMVDQLQTTLVSKNLLEASEEKLRATVVDLKSEITERQRAQQARNKLQAELRRAETMAAMGSLIAGVAHEVRNPLFGISSTLDAMNARLGDREGYGRYREVLYQEVERLNHLMQELLQYGKPPALKLTRGGVMDAVGPAINACAPLARQAEVEIVNRVAAELPAIDLDRDRLTQVFQNLIQNAIQHSPCGSNVALTVEATRGDGEHGISCAIKDHGHGLAAGDAQRIFEPFFTKRKGGTGLGLAIVRRIVEEHRGDISAANGPAGGAVMTVRLPAAIESAASEANPSP